MVYCQRAKLFQISSNGEWKERGIGNIKILRLASTASTTRYVVIRILLVSNDYFNGIFF